MTLQRHIYAWMDKAFGHRPRALTRKERVLRMLEEIMEACQAADIKTYEITRQMDYTYSREPGVYKEELQQVLLCVLGAAEVEGVEILEATYKELIRVDNPDIIAKMQDKVDMKVRAGVSTAWRQGHEHTFNMDGRTKASETQKDYGLSSQDHEMRVSKPQPKTPPIAPPTPPPSRSA